MCYGDYRFFRVRGKCVRVYSGGIEVVGLILDLLFSSCAILGRLGYLVGAFMFYRDLIGLLVSGVWYFLFVLVWLVFEGGRVGGE